MQGLVVVAGLPQTEDATPHLAGWGRVPPSIGAAGDNSLQAPESNGAYIRAHTKSLKKAKAKLKELTSRSQGRNVRAVMQKVKVYIRGWLGYFGIASMKTTMGRWDEWLRRRIRMYIWKQWKNPRTRVKNLIKLGMPQWQAYRNGNSQKGYWAVAGSGILAHTITNTRLAAAGYFEILKGNLPFPLPFKLQNLVQGGTADNSLAKGVVPALDIFLIGYLVGHGNSPF